MMRKMLTASMFQALPCNARALGELMEVAMLTMGMSEDMALKGAGMKFVIESEGQKAQVVFERQAAALKVVAEISGYKNKVQPLCMGFAEWIDGRDFMTEDCFRIKT